MFRPPDTPLNSYYMAGRYDKALPQAERFQKLQAFPVGESIVIRFRGLQRESLIEIRVHLMKLMLKQ